MSPKLYDMAVGLQDVTLLTLLYCGFLGYGYGCMQFYVWLRASQSGVSEWQIICRRLLHSCHKSFT